MLRLWKFVILLLFIIKRNNMKSFIYFGLIALTLGLTACEKESYDYAASEQLTLTERFDRADKPEVLFQFARRDLATGQETGWIIDRQGWVKSYERKLAPGAMLSANNEQVAALEVHNLYSAASAGLFQIDKEELAQYFFLSSSLQQNQLSVATSQSGVQQIDAVFAYTQQTFHQSVGTGGNCNGGSQDLVSITQIERRVVEIDGPESRYTTSLKGQELQLWLHSLEAQALNSKQ